MQTLSSQLSSTPMQLLFSFGRGMRVEKTLMQLSLLNSHQLSCNSCSRLTGAWELRKLSCKLSLLNSHQLSCHSCSRLNGAWESRKLSCKLSLLNSDANSRFSTLMQTLASQLSCKLSLLNSHANSRFSTLMKTLASQLSCNLSLLNSHPTLVLVWPVHESWENSHANSRFSTLMQTLMQSLASQLSCNSCSRLTGARELRKLSCKLSLLKVQLTHLIIFLP
jgi:hypothetical protein